MTLAPFPTPEFARFPVEDHHKKTVDALFSPDGKEQLISIGRGAIYASDLALSNHFHSVTVRMGAETIERSFKRGACIALATLSLDKVIRVDSDSVIEHMQDLNDYRNEEETFASAAMRIGTQAAWADTTMAKRVFEVGLLHNIEQYDPAIMIYGASYMQLIAERHLQKLDEDELTERSDAERLQFEFGERLSDLSATFEKIVQENE